MVDLLSHLIRQILGDLVLIFPKAPITPFYISTPEIILAEIASYLFE